MANDTALRPEDPGAGGVGRFSVVTWFSFAMAVPLTVAAGVRAMVCWLLRLGGVRLVPSGVTLKGGGLGWWWGV